jgi:hypothetical protein
MWIQLRRRRLCINSKTQAELFVLRRKVRHFRRQKIKGLRWRRMTKTYGQGHGGKREENASGDIWQVIVQKRPPGLRRWFPSADQVLGDSLLGDVEAQQGAFLSTIPRSSTWFVTLCTSLSSRHAVFSGELAPRPQPGHDRRFVLWPALDGVHSGLMHRLTTTRVRSNVPLIATSRD